MATRTRIVRIGNSRGIRIPKTLLDEADLPDEVERHAQPGRLVVQPENKTNQQDREPDEICKTFIPCSNPGGASKFPQQV